MVTVVAGCRGENLGEEADPNGRFDSLSPHQPGDFDGMEPAADELGVLQNLEATVISAWRRHGDMTDYVAGRAYQAAFERYRAEARGHTLKPNALTGLDREVFDALIERCELRLGRGGLEASPSEPNPPVPPIPLTKLVDCLRTLLGSVERHTKDGGRQGYLTFVGRFMP